MDSYDKILIGSSNIYLKFVYISLDYSILIRYSKIFIKDIF